MTTAAPDGTRPGLADLAVGAANAALGFGPALLRRTIDQIEFARALIRRAACATDSDATPAEELASVVPLRTDTRPEPKPANRATSAGGEHLAIPSYDDLAASQVIPLLDGLGSDELEAVRRHEAGGRGRRTVLSRIAQIQAG